MLFLGISYRNFLQVFFFTCNFLRQFSLSMAQNVSDGCLRLNVIYDATVGLQLRALWSEVLACFANCWQKIVISPQEMLANIWHYM